MLSANNTKRHQKLHVSSASRLKARLSTAAMVSAMLSAATFCMEAVGIESILIERLKWKCVKRRENSGLDCIYYLFNCIAVEFIKNWVAFTSFRANSVKRYSQHQN